MKADPKTEAAVMSVVNQFVEAFKTHHISSGLDLFASDPDVVFIGTGGDEKCIGLAEIKAELERAFAQSEQALIKIGWYSVSSASLVAWGTADAVIHATVSGQEISFPVRLTTVLEQRSGRWLIVQLHASVPAAGQKEGQAWPTDSS
jgi:uncharacterized protein (TIGR02246 family)